MKSNDKDRQRRMSRNERERKKMVKHKKRSCKHLRRVAISGGLMKCLDCKSRIMDVASGVFAKKQ